MSRCIIIYFIKNVGLYPTDVNRAINNPQAFNSFLIAPGYLVCINFRVGYCKVPQCIACVPTAVKIKDAAKHNGV